MADTIRAHLNHYQMLGVSPDASGHEIARAFAGESNVLRPHAFGVLAELCLAYEVLRDPIKRRAYDAAIGLKRKPTLQTYTAGARQAIVARGPAAPVERLSPAKVPSIAPRPIQGSPDPLAIPALPLGSGADLNISREPSISRAYTSHPMVEEALNAKARPVDRRRTGILLGALVVAASAVASLAGWWSTDAIGRAAQPENTVSISLPEAKPVAEYPTPQTAPSIMASESGAAPSQPAVAAVASSEPADAPEAIEVEPEPQQDQGNPSLVVQAAAEPPAASTTAAPMPLPNIVIARTIHRIGFSCGNVASTQPVEGEAKGVFKVTCSSGQSYQAKPVNGRYRFKRWGRR